jgi:hypothetical protein
MKKEYDLVIIGAGPAGLTLAHCCSRMGLKILVVDREKTIGGCHRVIRTKDGLFTEHSPRVYFTFYVNLFHIMSEIGVAQEDIFVPYKYTSNDIANKFYAFLSIYEILAFMYAYTIYIFNPNYGKSISLATFAKTHNFSEVIIDKLDRICRVADGTDIYKYSLNKFLSAINNSTSDIIQPKEPLDKSLFRHWKTFLEGRNVDFVLGKELLHLHYNEQTKQIDYIVLENQHKIHLNKLVLAIPPANISGILKTNKDIKNAFGDYHKFHEWSKITEYNEYISITYHFKDKVDIPHINGITLDTDWGIVVIALSDYMGHIEDGYKTVLSVGISIPKAKSKVISKSANECTPEELYIETHRQIKGSIYPDLPDNYHAILNPNQYYHEKEWKSHDEAYFNTVGTQFLPFQSDVISNLYNVGTQNGKSYVDYTTMESAVSNAMVLSYNLYPQLREYYWLRKSLKLRDIIIYILIVLLILIIIYYLIKMFRNM